MRVGVLLVEGKRDARIMNALCGDRPAVDERSSGGRPSLAQRVLHRRAMLGTGVFALRDRDFDFEPPSDAYGVWKIWVAGDEVTVGFYWRGHEIENYLLSPPLLGAALESDDWWDTPAYEDESRRIAHARRYHFAMRRTLAKIRAGRELPHAALLSDRPEVSGWPERPPTKRDCIDAIDTQLCEFVDHARRACDVANAKVAFEQAAAAVDDAAWFESDAFRRDLPGKDLAQALRAWVASRRGGREYDLCDAAERHLLREPSEALQLVPDFQCLLTALRENEF